MRFQSGSFCSAFFEADARTRTGDPFITSEVLYQLSYVGGAQSLAVRRLALTKVVVPAHGNAEIDLPLSPSPN